MLFDNLQFEYFAIFRAEEGSITSIFPGKATILSTAQQLTTGKITEKFRELIKEEEPHFLIQPGDTLKVRITDPCVRKLHFQHFFLFL